MYCVTSKFYVHVNSNAMFCYMEVQWSLTIMRYMESIVNDCVIAEAHYIETY